MRIVIAGGGVAAVEALLALRSAPELDASIELVAPSHAFVFRPSAPGVPYGLGGDVRLALDELTAAHGATYRADGIVSVETADHVAVTASGARLPYEVLIVAVGAKRAWTVAGAVRYFGSGKDTDLVDLLAEVDQGRVRQVSFAVPPGFTWPLPAYELAVLTASRAAARDLAVEATVVTPEDGPLLALGAVASDRAAALLRAAGVRVITAQTPKAYADGLLTCTPGPPVAAEAVVAIPRLYGPALGGLSADEDGFIVADAVGRVAGAPGVYGAGDAVVSAIKQGELAARQADVVVETVLAGAGLGPAPQPVATAFDGELFTGLTAHRLTGPSDSAEPWSPAGQAGGRYLPGLIAAAC